MVTSSDLIQTGILVVAIISLFVQVNKKTKRSNRPSSPTCAVTSLTKQGDYRLSGSTLFYVQYSANPALCQRSHV